MKKFILLLVVFSVGLVACRDEALNPVPPFETAVHGYGHLVSGNTFTGTSTDPNTGLFIGGTVAANNAWDFNIDFQWISIDQKNTVTKVEMFATFTEPYRDANNNNKTANHGTQLLKTFEGASVPGNRTSFNVQVTAAELFAAFDDATFNYGDGNVTVNVLSNPNQVPGQPAVRNPASPSTAFLVRDKFEVTWILYTADGRVFDSWSDSICSEFPGADCSVIVTLR